MIYTTRCYSNKSHRKVLGNLMFQSTLLKLSSQLRIGEPGYKQYIFEIMCRIRGNFCYLIVYGGGSENLMSIEVIEKLKLKCRPLP